MSDTIQPILENTYKLPKATLTKITAGEENKTFLVEASQRNYILRVYSVEHSIRGLRSLDSIREELAFIEHCASRLACPLPIRIPNTNEKIAKSTIQDEDHYVVLFEFIEGASPKEFTPEIARLFGHLTNQLYESSADYIPLHVVKGYTLLDRTDKISVQLNTVPKTIESLVKLLREGLEISKSISDHLTTGLVHGDVKLANTLYCGNNSLYLIDFDDYRYSYLIEDTVMALMHNITSRETNIIRSGNYQHFMKGITNPGLLRELSAYLKPFLQTRLYYDICKLLHANKHTLIEDILNDQNVIDIILS